MTVGTPRHICITLRSYDFNLDGNARMFSVVHTPGSDLLERPPKRGRTSEIGFCSIGYTRFTPFSVP